MKYSLSFNFNSFLIGWQANVIKHTRWIITITYILLLSCPEISCLCP
jgi:biotin transporter BioY